jgi:hypothetical protein
MAGDDDNLRVQVARDRLAEQVQHGPVRGLHPDDLPGGEDRLIDLQRDRVPLRVGQRYLDLADEQFIHVDDLGRDRRVAAGLVTTTTLRILLGDRAVEGSAAHVRPPRGS